MPYPSSTTYPSPTTYPEASPQVPAPSRAARRAPLELDVEITDANGASVILNAGDRRAANRPLALSFATQRGDGFVSGGFGLRRDVLRDYVDLNLLDGARFLGRGGEVAYEGRVHSYPRSNDPNQSFAVTLIGWMTTAKFRTFQQCYVDRLVSRWEAPSSARKAALLGAGYTPDKSLGSSAEAGTLLFSSESGQQVADKSIAEVLYRLPRGLSAAKVMYAGTEANTTNLAAAVLTGADDDAISSGVVIAGMTLDGTLRTLTLSAAKRFLMLSAVATATWTPAAGSPFSRTLAKLAVYGDTGLATHPALVSGDPDGIFSSEIMADIVGRFTPLSWGGDPTTYPVSQAAWLEASSPYAALQALNDLHMWNTSVFEDRVFRFYAPDLTQADWKIRTDEAGVRFTPLQGDSIDTFANGVEVTYTDIATGITETLYPSDFGELRDEAEDNPATVHGDQLWTPFTCPYPTVQGDALQMGRAYLAEYNRPKAPGSISLAGGYIRDGADHPQPAWRVREGQSIAIENHPNDAPRLITATAWDQDSRSLTISVDGGDQRLEAYLNRMGVARTAAGFG